jgi:hypothetical protein
VPASFDELAQERDALARIERWHGPGEWQAAMLALALDHDHDPANRSERWAEWALATADLPVAAAVRREIEALGAPARRRVFALLLQRAREAAPAQRRRLWRALRQRWRQLPPSPAAAWHMLALSLLLSTRRRPMAVGDAGRLARHAGAARAASAELSRALGASADPSQAWLNAAVQQLEALGVAAARSRAAGLAPPTSGRNLFLALRVRRLAPMQRPLLLRAWLQAAEHSGLETHAGTGDALHLACLLLDLPPPETMAR